MKPNFDQWLISATEQLPKCLSKNAGKAEDLSQLIKLPRLITAYYSKGPNPSHSTQRISFGTSGHRGSPFQTSFNEAHILAVEHAIGLHLSKKRRVLLKQHWLNM